jgi:hypothetical protein
LISWRRRADTNPFQNMKAISLLTVVLFAAAGTGWAQIEHQIRGNPKIAFSMQQTPQFNVSGPKDKRVSPQEWLEIEVELDLETVNKSGFLEQLDTTFYIALKDAVANKAIILEDKITFLEVNARDRKTWLVAYVSPATLARVLQKTKPSVSDVEFAAVSISGPGLRQTVENSTGGPKEWWKSGTAERRNNLILPKSKTAFAPLWWDRHPRTQDTN